MPHLYHATRAVQVSTVVVVAVGILVVGAPHACEAQALSYRGSLEVKGTAYPQEAANDPVQWIGDVRGRVEAFVKPADWLQLGVGIDALVNSYDQVDYEPAINVSDRGMLRPLLSVRRASATLTRRALTVEVGKQFIRWGKADVVTPTDRFAPRDFLNVIDSELLAVRAGRVAWATSTETLEGVVSIFTPSRIPLLDQRWTVAPAEVGPIALEHDGSRLPTRAQVGARWSHIGRGYEYSLTFFDGFNHLPNIELSLPTSAVGPASEFVAAPVRAVRLARAYPTLRMYGGDLAVPTPWVTIKAEVAHFGTRTSQTDEYLLHVVQLERQTGEWLLVGGYAGEYVTHAEARSNFAPDRGAARAFLGRASYTIDANRSAAVETAIRQNGDGVYVKGEFSKASGPHWRTTVAGAIVRGQPDDFLGQFRRNSHVGLSVRYSF